MRVQLDRCDVRECGRTFTVTIEGCQHEIPEVWSIAWCRTHDGDVMDAALAWHEQAEMEAAFNGAAHA